MLSVLLLSAVATASPLFSRSDVKSCSAFSSLPYSCENSTAITSDDCCFERPGLILQTQFWDYSTSSSKRNLQQKVSARDSSSNPVDKTFTIHGLWSDYCPTSDGKLAGWPQYCLSDLELDEDEDMEDLISNQFNKPDLYQTMSLYWLDESGDDLSLWIHEYNKHGTCMNTVRPDCFSGTYTKYEAAVEFFQKVVDQWETLPTYQWLEDAGITPDADQTYQLSDVKAALKAGFGKEVYVGCKSKNIDEIWYYYHVKGSVLGDNYKAVDSIGDDGCPDEVYYLPK